MVRHSNSLVAKARDLMINGNFSCREIASDLGINDSVVSKWCRGIDNDKNRAFVDGRIATRNKLLLSEKATLENIDWSNEKAKFYCALIYGCEGAKYPASNCMSLTNSDPNMIMSFVTLMRRAFHLDESRWRVLLQIHEDQDFFELREFWSKLLKISEGQFYKPTITKASEKKRAREYLGTCTVRYGSYELQLKLIGLYQEFLRRSILI